MHIFYLTGSSKNCDIVNLKTFQTRSCFLAEVLVPSSVQTLYVHSQACCFLPLCLITQPENLNVFITCSLDKQLQCNTLNNTRPHYGKAAVVNCTLPWVNSHTKCRVVDVVLLIKRSLVFYKLYLKILYDMFLLRTQRSYFCIWFTKACTEDNLIYLGMHFALEAVMFAYK